MSGSTSWRDRASARRLSVGAVIAALCAGGLAAVPASSATASRAKQPVLSTRVSPIITVHGLKFRDLNKDGKLTPYEDWRLSAQRRATDLVDRLTLEERAGLLMHAPHLMGTWNMDALRTQIVNQHMSTYLSATSTTVDNHVSMTNQVQQIADGTDFGIPVVFSSDPRHGFSVATGITVENQYLTSFPDAIGFGAIGDPKFTKKASDVMRQELRAIGIQMTLSPQADLTTEPRWSRVNGTFGSQPYAVKKHVKAYVEGFQNGSAGLNPRSVGTVVKHWVGYGAQENGYDSHYFYGRYATFPGNNFAAHLVPYEGAFAAKAAGIMPTYSILKNLVYQGTAVEQVGAGYSTYLLQDLLRNKYRFDGVVVSDWGILNDCPAACQALRPPAPFFYTDSAGNMAYGMPWGMIDATKVERYGKSFTAGLDQVGGGAEPEIVVQAVKAGLLSAQNVRMSALRVLKQKFELGLFENPYVNVAASKALVKNAAFEKIGREAQIRSLTLLANKKATLPITNTKQKVFLFGVDADTAAAKGFTVVTDPAQANLAIIRLSDPRGGADLTDLNFTDQADYQALMAATRAGVTTIAVPNLSRPLILTNVVDRAAATLANYGVSDDVLLDVIVGKAKPGGKLPFELPSSMDAVKAQLTDVPDDSKKPLFRVNYGLSYPKIIARR